MNRNRLAVRAVAVVAVAWLTAGCIGGTPLTNRSSAPPPSSASVQATPSTSPQPTSTPSPAATATSTPAAAEAQARTTAQLRKALLTVDETPFGFGIDPQGVSDVITAWTNQPECASLVKFVNRVGATGSIATAKISFSGSHGSPTVTQVLVATDTRAAASEIVESFRAAVADCKKVTFSFGEFGEFSMKVVEIPLSGFSGFSGDSFAARFTATSGEAKGIPFDYAVVQTDDILTRLEFAEAEPTVVEDVTKAAVSKVTAVLGTSTMAG